MSWSWERRIARAEELQARFPESAALLAFYGRLARYQQSIARDLNAKPESDPCALAVYSAGLIELLRRHGPAELANDAQARSSAPAAWQDLLINTWSGSAPDDEQAKFCARALLQPFAEALAGRGHPDTQSTAPVCPFCSARPVAGILRGEGDGARRSLLCSLCATEWQFRRVICPNCGEEDKERLPVYRAADPVSVRVDACDTCRTYIKSVDLTKDGLAVPVVDEIATPALTLWAEENGYTKVETNLLGM